MSERRLPPVTQIGMASLALIVAGGHLPVRASPPPCSARPGGRPAGRSRCCCSRATSWRSRSCRTSRWRRFFAVAKWTLLAYVIIAGMIEYSFLRDHIRGGVLVVLTLSLVVFAVHVPVLVGFTVARFAEPEPALG